MTASVLAIHAETAEESVDSFLLVRVKPRAARAGLLGRHGAGIKIAVRSPPEGGRANEELLRFVADLLGVQAGAVEIVTGGTSRHKRLRILGLDAAALERRLEEALEAL